MESRLRMAMAQLQICIPKKFKHKKYLYQQGFALVSAITLVPFFLTVVLSLCAAMYCIKKKSLAQSICVREAVQLQQNLKKILEQLLKLNHKSRLLRAERLKADQKLASAIASLNPYAIATAKAYQAMVILNQMQHRSLQERFLLEAKQARLKEHRELVSELRRLQIHSIDSQTYYWRPLAVEPEPATSLTPDYNPVHAFTLAQQHRFKYHIDLTPPFKVMAMLPGLRQKSECSASLTRKENLWFVQILADNRISKIL